MSAVLNTDSATFAETSQNYTLTFNANFGASVATKLVVVVAGEGNGIAPSIIEVVFGVDQLSAAGGAVTSFDRFAQMWYLDDPPTTTTLLSVRISSEANNATVEVYLVSNIAAGAPSATDSYSNFTSSDANLSVTTAIPTIAISGLLSSISGNLTGVTGADTTPHPDGIISNGLSSTAAAYTQASANPSVTYEIGASSSVQVGVMAAWEFYDVVGVKAAGSVGNVRAGVTTDPTILNSAVVAEFVGGDSVSRTMFNAASFTQGVKLVVGAGLGRDIANISQLTFNGSALTQAVAQGYGSGGDGVHSQLWYLDNPDSVYGTLQFTGFLDSLTAFVYLFDRLQAGAPTATDSATQDTPDALPTVTAGSQTDGVAVSNVMSDDGSIVFATTTAGMLTLPGASDGVSNPPSGETAMGAYTLVPESPGVIDHSYSTAPTPNLSAVVMAYWEASPLVEIVPVTGLSANVQQGTSTVSASGVFGVSGVGAAGAVGDVVAESIILASVTGVSAAGVLGDVTLVANAHLTVSGIGSAAALGNVEAQIIGQTELGSLLALVSLGDVAVRIDYAADAAGLPVVADLGSATIRVDNRPYPASLAAAGKLGVVTVSTSANVAVEGVQSAAEVDTALAWGIIAPAGNPNWTEIIP